MSERPGVFVFGASGHGKVVIDAIECAGEHRILFVLDDAKERHGTLLMGYEVIGGREQLRADAQPRVGVVGIGANGARRAVAEWLVDHGCTLASVVHPSATIARDVEIGAGSVVVAGCVVNPGARVGRNVILNTGATVDHDCEIGDDVHIAPGSHLCGHVRVGAGALIGAGATIIPGISIGRHATVGAGSIVIADVPDGARVAGNPCRSLA
ncbi:MAG TPA: acetyltransferase [Burkholderiales bacterium]|nr:acetyltransferase [Burkholderiales bacterium]